MALSQAWSSAIVLLCLLYFFANMASGVGNVSVQAITPSHLRARASAVYLAITGILGLSVGPLAVALLTDRVFGDPKAVNYSIAIVGGLFSVIGGLIFGCGARAFGSSAMRNLPRTSTTKAA
jgi:hypothetical protein